METSGGHDSGWTRLAAEVFSVRWGEVGNVMYMRVSGRWGGDGGVLATCSEGESWK